MFSVNVISNNGAGEKGPPKRHSIRTKMEVWKREVSEADQVRLLEAVIGVLGLLALCAVQSAMKTARKRISHDHKKE